MRMGWRLSLAFWISATGAWGANQAPVLIGLPQATPQPALANQHVVFSATAQDAEGDALTYRWDFSDGWSATGRITERRFGGGALTYAATVTVSDVWGGAATGVISVATLNSPALWSGPVQEPIAPTNWTRGQKSVLFMVLAFPDFAPSVSSSHLARITGEVSNFYASCSHGLLGLVPTVAPVLPMSLNATNYAGANIQRLLCEARGLCRAQGFPPEPYDFEVFIIPSGKGLPGTSASIGNRLCFINANGTNVVNAELAHELGHGLGLQHANAWITRERSVIGTGQGLDYGNPFDVMGGAISFPLNHLSPYAKHRLGWLEDAQAPVVTNRATVRLHAHDVTPWSPDQTLALRAQASWRRYWLEHRRLFTNNLWLTHGVVLLAEPFAGTDQESVLLDATPGSLYSGASGPGQIADAVDSVLLVGRTFADPDGQLFITPWEATGETNALDVQIEFGPFPTNLPPTLTLAASSTQVVTGAAVNFTATASDPNGDALAYYWSFSDGPWWSTNGPVISKSFSQDGDYLARCEVTDGRGGVASHQVLIRVGTPATFRLRGLVTVSNQPLEGVRVAAATNLFAWTDSTGAYTIPGVPSGSYTVTAARGDTLFTRTFTQPVLVSGDVTGLNHSVLFNNTPPVLVPPAPQVVNEDGVAENIVFSLSDTQSSGREVLLTMASDNPALLDAGDFRFQLVSTNPTLRRMSFHPRPGQSGSATITLTASDGRASTSALFTVTVVPVNDPPLSRGADFVAGGPVVIASGAGALAGVTDDEGDPVTAQMVAAPLHGQALLQPDGLCIYVPHPGFSGQDGLIYAAQGGPTGNLAALVFQVTAPTSTWYDVWALQNFAAQFTNTAVAAGAVDPDEDGVDNQSEFIAATRPTEISDYPRIASIDLPLALRVAGVTGRLYAIDYADDAAFGAPTWQPLATGLPGLGSLLTIPDPSPAPQRIYRLRIQLAP